jgi:AcrR family transcriptional regulator
MPPRTTPDVREPKPLNGASDLRLRKRIRTKQMVQKEAMRLFADNGYEQTTVDDIAHAAAMSPRTFFRYFPTKEDVVLWDEYDEQPLEELFPLPAHADPFVFLIQQIRRSLADLYTTDPQLLLARVKLSFAIPDIRARFINNQMTMIGPHLQQISAAARIPSDDLRLPVTLAALYSATMVAVERWQRSDGRDDLMRLLDDAIQALAASATDIRDAIRAANKRASRTR